jgi:hypothetical protein
MSWRKRVSSNGYGSESAVTVKGAHEAFNLPKPASNQTSRPQKYFYAAAELCDGHYGGAFCGVRSKLFPTLVAYAGQNETVGPMWIAIEKRHVEKIRPRRSAGSIAQRIAQHNNLPIVVAI